MNPNGTQTTTAPRAIVIGSGFGGLAAAVRLQAMGYQTQILEQRPQVGGRAYQFKEAGYTFDMGPSLITAPDIIEDVFAAAGRRRADYLDFLPLDPFYRIFFHDGSHIDYNGDAAQMKAQMAVNNPGDAGRYDAFMAAIRPIHQAIIADRLRLPARDDGVALDRAPFGWPVLRVVRSCECSDLMQTPPRSKEPSRGQEGSRGDKSRTDYREDEARREVGIRRRMCV